MGCVVVKPKVYDLYPESGLVTRPMHMNCAVHPNYVIPAPWQRESCKPGRGTQFTCGDGLVGCQCGGLADYLCDYPMGKGKTCDAPLCAECRVPQVGDQWGLDFCRAHEVLKAVAR